MSTLDQVLQQFPMTRDQLDQLIRLRCSEPDIDHRMPAPWAAWEAEQVRRRSRLETAPWAQWLREQTQE